MFCVIDKLGVPGGEMLAVTFRASGTDGLVETTTGDELEKLKNYGIVIQDSRLWHLI